jgi:uncharacterized small protein (DUF1192 family)
MSPSSLVEGLLAKFCAEDPRETQLVEAFRELVALQKFDPATGKMVGPRMNLTAIAVRAKLKVKLISHEGCKLPHVRELLVDALEVLSQHSLQVQCDFLSEEVKRLRARIDRKDSAAANRVVMLHKQRTAAQPTPAGTYSAQDVRDATRLVLPMDQL